MTSTRAIIHIDMDAFYASVEMLDNPDYRGKPVIVGGSDNRGVVSAASYPARAYGVHSAMPIAVARRKCPEGIFLSPRMARYQEVSRQIMHIFRDVTPLVEPLSLDEAFLDVTASGQLFGSPIQIARTIKARIASEIGLTASAGIATSKLLAKIASDIKKPDGLTIVPYGEEQAFLSPLTIGKLWGVGKVMQKELLLLGVETIGDLAKLSLELLEKKFGNKTAEHLYRTSRAIDSREVVPERTIKSIGNEETFERDLIEFGELKKELLLLAEEVGRRMRRQAIQGKTITLKVKFNDFKQITRSKTIHEATNDTKKIYNISVQLLNNIGTRIKPIRLLGISLANLNEGNCPVQRSLFDDQNDLEKNSRMLNAAIDTISEKHGIGKIRPATIFKK